MAVKLIFPVQRIACQRLGEAALLTNHLPPEGAWWLRDRVENKLPVHFNTTVLEASEKGGRVALRLGIPYTMGKNVASRLIMSSRAPVSTLMSNALRSLLQSCAVR